MNMRMMMMIDPSQTRQKELSTSGGELHRVFLKTGQLLASFSQTSVMVAPVSLKYILHALLSFNYQILAISNIYVPKYALPKF